MKTKVLHILSALDYGGVEMMLLNYYRKLDKDCIVFDFIVHGKSVGKIENDFLGLGSTIFHVTPKKESFLKNTQEINRILQTRKYDIVHIHLNLSSFSSAILAKINRNGIVIVHSHGVGMHKGILFFLSPLLKQINNAFTDYFFACSNEAGEWLFGDLWSRKKDKCYLMNNAIDTVFFAYSEVDRFSMRKILGVEESFVLIYVARMDLGKNHRFLIEILSQIIKQNNSVRLLLIGEGNLETQIHSDVAKYNLVPYVKFLGKRSDINKLFSASDLFIFPSFYEGFGMVAIEAQVNGLPVIASTNIPTITKISNLIEYVPLSAGSQVWTRKILAHANRDRVIDEKSIDKLSVDISAHVKRYEDIVNTMISKKKFQS